MAAKGHNHASTSACSDDTAQREDVAPAAPAVSPKAFISYSWTSPGHQAMVKDWADQLLSDGVDVVLDVYDFKEGQDKYVFMERMVSDPTVSHVLVISDSTYARKADERRAGVGTESQIISKEVYEKTEQSKFIPIVCEFSKDGEPCLPTFMQSRKWIDFSSPESANKNWEQLIRVLHGRPLYQKPARGRMPEYLDDNNAISTAPLNSVFNVLRQALLQEKRSVGLYRREFLARCIQYADGLRVRARPGEETLGRQIISDYDKLRGVRNIIVDWVLLDSEVTPPSEFEDALLTFLEDYGRLKNHPPEMTTWNDRWFEAHVIHIYETFIYIVAALIKTGRFPVLRSVFTNRYCTDEDSGRYRLFECFYGHSDVLQAELAPPGQRLFSPAAELMKRHADRPDLPLAEIIQAGLVILLVSVVTADARWYPQTLHYASHNIQFPLFARAGQRRGFERIAALTGVTDADELRRVVREKIGDYRWIGGREGLCHFDFWQIWNMERLNSM